MNLIGMNNMKNTVRIWPTRHSNAKQDHLERYFFASKIIKEETTCIDAACGVGYGTSLLHHANINVVGIDISHEAISHACNYFQTKSGPDFICADIMNYSLSADTLVSFETIEHLSDAEKFLSNFEVNNIIASVPNQLLYPFNAESFINDEYPHLRHYTPDQFDEIFNKIGFKVIGRFTQRNKESYEIVDGVDGRYLIYVATKVF